MKKLAVFASGNGTNFEVIANEFKVEILIVDKKNAYAIERAKKLGIECLIVLPKTFESKKEYEIFIVKELKKRNIELIALAGYMRLVGDVLLRDYEGCIINIHPSLLPKYKGLNALGQALDAKDEIVGCTIHFVDSGMDTGSIIRQRSFSVLNKTIDEIEEELHKNEHSLYIEVLKELL